LVFLLALSNGDGRKRGKEGKSNFLLPFGPSGRRNTKKENATKTHGMH